MTNNRTQSQHELGPIALIFTAIFWMSGTIYNGPLLGIGCSFIGVVLGGCIEQHHQTALPFFRRNREENSVELTTINQV